MSSTTVAVVSGFEFDANDANSGREGIQLTVLHIRTKELTVG